MTGSRALQSLGNEPETVIVPASADAIRKETHFQCLTFHFKPLSVPDVQMNLAGEFILKVA